MHSRVWSGSDAIRIGLVDSFGGLTDAVKEAAVLAGIAEYKVKELPEQVDIYTSLLNDLNEEMKMRTLREELGINMRYFLELREILSMEGPQARIPYFLEIN